MSFALGHAYLRQISLSTTNRELNATIFVDSVILKTVKVYFTKHLKFSLPE